VLTWPARLFKPSVCELKTVFASDRVTARHPQSSDCRENRVLEHSIDPTVSLAAGSQSSERLQLRRQVRDQRSRLIEVTPPKAF
jgi:hypothetical protein